MPVRIGVAILSGLLRNSSTIAVVVLASLGISVVFGAQELIPESLTVGQNLEAEAHVKLNAPAPSEGLVVRVRSNDPARLLLSSNPLDAGSEWIQLRVDGGRTSTPVFYIHGLANSSTATYTLSAPDHGSSIGVVILVPSAILIRGPAKLGDPLATVSGAPPSTITVYSAQMDAFGQFSVVRPLRGGSSATVNITSSEPKVGKITTSPVTITGGDFSATTQFLPVGAGNTTVTLEVPPGFGGPTEFTVMKAMVARPGLAITDEVTVGANLESGGTLSLGVPAPEGGVAVKLTSSDPTRLLLSGSPLDVGSESISLTIPPGGHSATYFLQALGGSGAVTYNAIAPGFRDREATVRLVPSGVVLGGPAGPPDEAEVLRPEAPEGLHGFWVSLSAGTTPPIVVYSVYLDPKTHRGADITVQPLRPGISLTVALTNSNMAVGTLPSSLTIVGGSSQAATQFKPRSIGSAILSVTTPEGYTTPSNSTTLEALVTQ